MTVHAPFRFTPINEEVYFPKWGPLVSHDVPFKDGLSGEVAIEIEAKTPLLVGGVRRKAQQGREGEVWPFKAADGKYGIPDSTLQGMMRSIIEVAALGRLGPFVYDRGVGFRDLRSPTGVKYYQNRMTKMSGGVKPITVTPQAQPGWLLKDPNAPPGKPNLKIVKCSYARIDFEQLRALRGGSGPDPLARRSDAPERYNWWVGAGGTMAALNRLVQIGPRQPYNHAKGTIQIYYQRAFAMGSAGRVPCPSTTVFTGKTQDGDSNPGDKKLEFVFHTPDRPSATAAGLAELCVSEEVWRDFKLIHMEQPGRAANPNWTYWKAEFERGGAVPVFYLLDGSGKIATFGTAFMFKIAMELTTHDMLRNSSSDHALKDDRRLDMPSLIFGSAANDFGELGLKRRASFDMARLSHMPPGDHPVIERAILLEPKPSYFPSYVRQPGNRATGALDNRTLPFATYAAGEARDVAERKIPKLAGVKVWPAHNSSIPARGYPPHLENQRTIQVTLRPLPIGTKFRTTLRFHNLRPMELGAIVWAMSFGDAGGWDPSQPIRLRHRMGMGKPYGLGEISVRILPDTLTIERNDGATSVEVVSGLVKAFELEMAGAISNWRNLPQLRTLFAAANPEFGAERLKTSDTTFDYMILNPRGGPNEFSKAKDDGQFLPDYMTAEAVLQAQVGARIRMVVGPPTEGEIVEIPADPAHQRAEWIVRIDGENKTRRYRRTLFEIIG